MKCFSGELLHTCEYIQQVGNTYYVKCYNGISPSGTPPNSRRMQLASQYGTIDYDPTLPRINNTDTKACMRMKNYPKKI